MFEQAELRGIPMGPHGLPNTRGTSASQNAGFDVLSTAKASSLCDASLVGVARGGLGAKMGLLGLLRQGRTVLGAPQTCFTEG